MFLVFGDNLIITLTTTASQYQLIYVKTYAVVLKIHFIPSYSQLKRCPSGFNNLPNLPRAQALEGLGGKPDTVLHLLEVAHVCLGAQPSQPIGLEGLEPH